MRRAGSHSLKRSGLAATLMFMNPLIKPPTEPLQTLQVVGSSGMLEAVWLLLGATLLLMIGIMKIMKLRTHNPRAGLWVVLHYLLFLMLALVLQSLAAPWPTEWEHDINFYSIRDIFIASLIAVGIFIFAWLRERQFQASNEMSAVVNYKPNSKINPQAIQKIHDLKLVFLGFLLFLTTIFNFLVVQNFDFRKSGLKASDTIIQSFANMVITLHHRIDLWPNDIQNSELIRWNIIIPARDKARLSIIPQQKPWSAYFAAYTSQNKTVRGGFVYGCESWWLIYASWKRDRKAPKITRADLLLSELKNRKLSSFPWNWLGKTKIAVEKVELTENEGQFAVTTSSGEIWNWSQDYYDQFSFVSSRDQNKNSCAKTE